MLRLLDDCADPVVGAAELARYSAEQLTELLRAGILRETCRATEIPRPARFGPGADLIVRETRLGLFGVAGEDDYHDPIPLTEEDVRQYSVSTAGLVEQIRRRNGITGSGCKGEEGLILVGTKHIPGLASFPVYLSLPNLGEEVLLARCLRAKRGMPGALAVVLVPREPKLSAEIQRLLDEGGVRVVGLAGGASLEGLVVDWAAVLHSLPGSPIEKEQYAFRKKGESWELVFEGHAVMVTHSIGMLYLAELLRASGQELSALDLFAAAKGQDSIPLGSAGEVLDLKARRQYQRRAQELRDELEEAERDHDLGRKERIREELDHLADQFLAANGLSGRDRQAQLDRDRVRKSVSAAIRRALQAIRAQAPALAAHLHQHIGRGYYLSYTGSIPWKF